MKNKTLYPYHPYLSTSRILAALFVIAGLALAACISTGQTGPSPSPETESTLLPTPSTRVETEAPPPAYPPPVAVYPGPTDEPAGSAATAYPAGPTQPPNASTPTGEPPDESNAGVIDEVYVPMIGLGQPSTAASTAVAATAIAATPTPAATATAEPTATNAVAVAALPTPINVVDFAAARDELAAQGRQLAYNKIGFHVTFLEDRDELDPYMERLDSEGVPFFLKSVDNAEPLYKAQELMKQSGVPHTLVYRSTLYDVPDYSMDPIAAAEMYWELEKAIWPPELDPALIWLETMNELDKNRAEWLAQFSLRKAQLALRDGYRWAAFGWASGEPEPSDWESPAMLELLRLIADNPDRLAVALHEYSYVTDDIGDDYPHKVGRFLELFRVADEHGIPRPTVLITEWGWTYNDIPPEPLAMEHVTWAARLYGAYPEVLGAAIWNLGKLDDTLFPLNTQMQDLMDNMLALSLDSYFSAPAPPEQTSLDPNLFPPPAN